MELENNLKYLNNFALRNFIYNINNLHSEPRHIDDLRDNYQKITKLYLLQKRYEDNNV